MRLTDFFSGFYQKSKLFLEKAYLKVKTRFKSKPNKIKSLVIGSLALSGSYLLGFKNFLGHFVQFVQGGYKCLIPIYVFSGILANTSLDAKFSKFWQKNIEPMSRLKKVLKVCKRFGEYGAHLAVVLLVLSGLREKMDVGAHDDNSNDELRNWAVNAIFNFASCTLIQASSCFFLGGDRPEWKGASSFWRPCRRIKQEECNQDANEHSRWRDGRAFSGHAAASSFTMALGLETLEFIAEKDLRLQPVVAFVKPALLLSAAGCAISRVNDRAHYLSQSFAGAMLGAVSASQHCRGCLVWQLNCC